MRTDKKKKKIVQRLQKYYTPLYYTFYTRTILPVDVREGRQDRRPAVEERQRLISMSVIVKPLYWGWLYELGHLYWYVSAQYLILM